MIRASKAALAALCAALTLGACGSRPTELDFSAAHAMGEALTVGGVELTVTDAFFNPLAVAPEAGEAILYITVAYEGSALRSADTALTEKDGTVRAFFAGDGLDYLGYNRPAGEDAYVRFAVTATAREFLFTLGHGGDAAEFRIILPN